MQGFLARFRHGFGQVIGLGRAAGALTLAVAIGAGAAQAQTVSAIEMNSAGASTATQPTGTHVTNLAVTMQNNSDNPAGTTFGAVSPGPAPVVTFTLLNQQYTAPTVPATVSSTRTGVFMGLPGNSTPNAYYAPLSSIGSPANAHFTSLPFHATGQGINTTTNHGVRLSTSASALQLAGAPTNQRVFMSDMDITFNVPVTDPVLHFSGLGGSYGSKGFSAEFDLLPAASPNATGLTLLSGNGALNVLGNAIVNTSAIPAASCSIGAANKGACGSVVVTGEGITNVRLRVYLQSSQNLPWSDARTTTGDAFHIAVSTETADMTPALSGLPATIVPGTTYNATLTCTNAGPNTARGALCTPSADLGTVSNVVCTPAIPGDIDPTAPNNKTVCTFDYVLAVGGTQTQVTFTGQTGATNDRNGGAVGTAGNNQTQITRPVRAPQLRMVKVLNGAPGRDAPADQFTLTITGTGGPATTTTGGSGTTVTNGTATLANATAGQTYTMTETFAGSAIAANYDTAYSCVNALGGGTSVPGGTGTALTTPALVSGDEITCTFTNTFKNIADLVTVKTLASADADVEAGDTVSFLITVTNNGPATARNISLTDSLPAGLTPAAGNGTASAGSYNAGTGLWSIPLISSGGSATLTLTGTVDAGLAGDLAITNTTTAADGDQTDPSTTGDDLTETVTVIPDPILALVKTATYADANANGRVDAGDTVTYA